METASSWSVSMFCNNLFILPMRNGNVEENAIDVYYDTPFYPTYEEWKQSLRWIFPNPITPFYPTYEEWKHKTVKKKKGVSKMPFYPTYEEWKLFYLSYVRYFTAILFILPMRNGNCP